jgi:hypothetical protein
MTASSPPSLPSLPPSPPSPPAPPLVSSTCGQCLTAAGWHHTSRGRSNTGRNQPCVWTTHKDTITNKYCSGCMCRRPYPCLSMHRPGCQLRRQGSCPLGGPPLGVYLAGAMGVPWTPPSKHVAWLTCLVGGPHVCIDNTQGNNLCFA